MGKTFSKNLQRNLLGHVFIGGFFFAALLIVRLHVQVELELLIASHVRVVDEVERVVVLAHVHHLEVQLHLRLRLQGQPVCEVEITMGHFHVCVKILTSLESASKSL